MAEPLRRAAGWGAAGCALAGTAAVAVAVVAGPGPGPTGYVSEAGIAGSDYATAYRSGVLGLAVALLLLAAALPGAPRMAAGLLAAAAGGTAVSATVNCSVGCPLPPFESATTADLVHGAASIAAVACCVFAMLALAVAPVPADPARPPGVDRLLRDAGRTLPAGIARLPLPPWVTGLVDRLPAPPAVVGRLARAAVLAALPLSALVGLAMLGLGRGTVVGVLERLLLLVIAGWLVGTALALTRHRRD
ncbi:DUF998 domain-containing protein [Solwaraspora sp. WMMD1047]|uniref:DUF998 domain-containing protein n=1 Tax=Solwaraspora sp. WMMD1047 TaxID=3016102 RepID=UPI002417A759|nr:DUF998 domain-containing protein [Solwaraspora sp. WMMD1047]MDG4829642.1 DUF998 domain-containing protein [Solwaraspora sp. WMMD1047]